jgi:uncharacterized protein YdeI (YjbR/CyaY-like superfamily)
MPADDEPLLELPDRSTWEAWLREHHASTPAVWLKLAKKGAPRTTVTQPEAIEVALCWGWIDGQLGRLDEFFYRQRFTRRRPRSNWSQVNRRKALELIERGLMQPPGLAAVEAAQADGRWDAAYPSQAAATVPEDFAAALAERPRAEAFFATLRGVSRYAFLYRIAEAKRPETRARRIARFVELLDEGRTLH